MFIADSVFHEGHSGKVLCMSVTKHSQYLLTGSEDTSIIVWDLRGFTMHLRIYEHIAPVLCITSALNNSIIISGGEDSSIIITSLANGKMVSYIIRNSCRQFTLLCGLLISSTCNM